MRVVRATKPMQRSGDIIFLYEMEGGVSFTVNKHGWVLDTNNDPVQHPIVEDIMRAILAWERQLG